MKWLIWKRIRQGSQIVFFALAVFLLFAGLRGRFAFPLADIFFRFNPLSALASMISAREWIPRLGLALLTVGVTVLLGRVWCGWICPMGSLVEWVWFKGARKREGRVSPHWRTTKQVLLVAILAAAAVGNLSLLIFDPLGLFTRGMAVVVIPVLDRAVSAVEIVFYRAGFLSPLADWMEGWLRGPILPAERAVFAGSVLIAALLAGILALNTLADRFWCRYICPLGGLLGFLSRFSILRPVVGGSCKACGKCARVCRMGAISSSQGYQVVPSECVMCLDCLANCPQDEMGLKAAIPPRPAPVEGEKGSLLSRRQALGAMGTAVAAVLVAETGMRAAQPSTFLVRPPGAQDETEFLSRCLRCAECIRVCPTAGLQPALGEAGLVGIWTPRLASRLGACDYACTACGETCPSGAIPRLALDKKRETVIGLASVDRNRCLPWSYDTPCIVCEEMCPRPTKAIRLEEAMVTGADGQTRLLQRPYVLRDLCIGCGICENQCPLDGDAAIRVLRRTL
jgi:polyferredoxin/NAD-dependent dihydropyrimidine dehydrogenase PreA subunit